MYQILFIHSSVDRHLGGFHVLAIVNSAAVNTEVHLSFWIMVFSSYMPRSRIAGSYGGFTFSFLRKLHTVLHRVYTSLHSHWQHRRIPFSPYPLEHLLFVPLFTKKKEKKKEKTNLRDYYYHRSIIIIFGITFIFGSPP